MRYVVGLSMLVIGLIVGLLGDVPLSSPVYTSLEMVITGGFLVTAGVATILLSAAKRGSRDDEPEMHIRP